VKLVWETVPAVGPAEQKPRSLSLVLVHVRLHLVSSDCWTVQVSEHSPPGTVALGWCAQSRLGDRSFKIAGPRLWNSLPAELRQQDICFTAFRRLLKTFLFAETRRIVTSLFWWRPV